MTSILLIKAIIAAIGIGVATAPIGVFVLWRKMAYFADAISHSAIFGIAIATIVAVLPMYGIILCAAIFCILIFLIDKQNLYSSDSIIGIISCSLMSVGMILLAVLPEAIELEDYLFGDLLNLSLANILMIYLIVALVLVALYAWFRQLLFVTINSDLAKISGINSERLQLKFLLLTAFVVACLVKIVGIFLIVSIIILPAAIARNFSKTPNQMLFLAIAFSIVSMIFGAIISVYFKWPSSPSIVAFTASLLAASIIATRLRANRN